MARLRSVNPATAEEIEAFDIADGGEIDAALDTAASAARAWRDTPLPQRCSALRGVAAVLRRDVDAHAAAITAEMGKPISEAQAEVEKCAFCCEYFAGNAERFLAEESAPSDSDASFIRYEPLGTVLACMPWNFPYWQVFRCAAPALAAGNTVLLKHANNVTRCGLRIEAALREAGMPQGVFVALRVTVDAIPGLIADPRVAAVSLTGSTAAGRSVAAVAGAHIKKCVLELGGSDAFVVLADADVRAAAETGAKSRFQNAGQSCIAAKRFIVDEAVADGFEAELVQQAERIRVGDPTSRDTQMGPLARDDLRQNLERQARDSVARGARVVTGGERPPRPGFFLSPMVLTGCDVGMPAFTEETFGPMAAVTRVRGDDEAVEIANHSQYGLGGNVWSGDVEHGLAIARRLRTGGVFVNGMTHSDPRLPFGGVAESGYGRELHRAGIHEFVNVKTMWRPGRA